MPQESYVGTLKGREFKFHEPTETQLMMVARSMARAERAQKTEDINTAVFAIADMLDIVDSLIIDESDRDEFVRLMSIGQLEVSELMTAIHDARQEQQAPPAPAKPRVRRGSAR